MTWFFLGPFLSFLLFLSLLSIKKTTRTPTPKPQQQQQQQQLHNNNTTR
jgi:hypothetical protein